MTCLSAERFVEKTPRGYRVTYRNNRESTGIAESQYWPLRSLAGLCSANSQIMGKAEQDGLQEIGATARRDLAAGLEQSSFGVTTRGTERASSKVSTASRMLTTKCGRRMKRRTHLSQTGCGCGAGNVCCNETWRRSASRCTRMIGKQFLRRRRRQSRKRQWKRRMWPQKRRKIEGCGWVGDGSGGKIGSAISYGQRHG